MTQEEVGPGQTFGPYEVLQELGRGGMGRVFRARHVTLDREVALKLLAEGYAGDELFVQRFLKEARAVARLNHPGIVQIYDFGQVGPHWYLAMELVEGRSLAHFLKAWGRFSEANAIVIARQTLTALGVAHAAGIVHRDIKPDNLILGPKGVVKIVDLGLAKKLDDPGATATGFAAGTPYYISPEQIEGRADIDGRADLYSLGATLFQLVTGQVPFSGPSSAVIMSRHLNERAPNPRAFRPELSEAFSTAVLWLMARERDRRPRNAEEAERAFAAIQAGEALAPRRDQADPGSSSFETAVPNSFRSPEVIEWRTPAPAVAGPPPSAASGVGADATRLLEEKLAAHVGPLARVLVRNAAREATSYEDLRTRLALQIHDERARASFFGNTRSAGASSLSPGSGSGAGGPSAQKTPTPEPGSTPSRAASSSGPGSFLPALLATAEQKLASEIGPLARVLVKREAKRQATWNAFVEALSTQVPDEAGRKRLREALVPLGV